MRPLPGDPPPYLYHGPSILARFVFFALLALLLLFIDSRYRHLDNLRSGIAAALYPLQNVARWPLTAARDLAAYFDDKKMLRRDNDILTRALLAQEWQAQEAQIIERENGQLKALLSLKVQLPRDAQTVEALYGARDPFVQKIIIDRGGNQGVHEGDAVFDGDGVIGQVTHCFASTAEVTLLVEKNHMTPVQVARTGLRSVLYGMGTGQLMELRFVAPAADVRIGDRLVTSGLDNVYPPGLAVAEVVAVDHNDAQSFAHITARPIAGVDRSRYLLVLTAAAPPPAVALPPAPADNPPSRHPAPAPRNKPVRPAPPPADANPVAPTAPASSSPANSAP